MLLPNIFFYYLKSIDQLIVRRFVLVQSGNCERGRVRRPVVVDNLQFTSEQVPDGVHPFDYQTSLGTVHRQPVGVGQRRRSDVHRSTSSYYPLSVKPQHGGDDGINLSHIFGGGDTRKNIITIAILQYMIMNITEENTMQYIRFNNNIITFVSNTILSTH